MDRPNVRQFCEWINPLAKKDSAGFDLHGYCQDQTSILFQKDKLKSCSQSSSKHLNFRVFQGGKAGVSYTKDFSKEGLESCYRRALQGLKISDSREAGDMSSRQQYKDLSSFYNEDFKKMSMEDKIKKAEEMNTACLKFDKRAAPVFSWLYDFDNFHFFANSLGEAACSRAGDIAAGVQALAVEGESRSQGSFESSSKDYKSIDFKKIGSGGAEKAVKKLNYSIPKTGKMPVLFQSGPAAALLLKELAGLINGKLVFEGLSFLKDSLGKKIASEKISLFDDPFAAWGFDLRAFDGEGFAMEKTPLIKNGILENYLTSSFFAKALKAPHTKKADWINEKGSLGVSHTHLLMEEGKSSFNELLNEFPKTILVDNMKSLVGFNPVSGDFSKEAEGFLYEGGGFKPLCQFTVSGNIKDLFNNIVKTGDDSRVYSGELKAPSFLVSELMIAGL